MRSADLPGLCRFHGGCGSVCLSSRKRYQLSLDLRQLRLRLRDQAHVAAIGLQLGFWFSGLLDFCLLVLGFPGAAFQRGAMSPFAQPARVRSRKSSNVPFEIASLMSCISRW